jgi:hypothetical protein
MARTHISGPFDVTGGITDNNPSISPSTFYSGWALRDPRAIYGYGNIGGPRCIVDSGEFLVAEMVPPTLGAAVIVPAATGTSGTAMTLVSTSGSGIYVNIPFVPDGQAAISANVIKVLALGPGHTIGTTTATNKTIASVGTTCGIMKGSWICIPDGMAAGTPYIGQVVSKTETTLTMATAPAASVSGGAIFLMDPTGTTVVCRMRMGVTDLFGGGTALDPFTGVGRGVSVTNNNVGDTGWTATIVGYDAYGVKTTQAQAVTANNVAYSTKTFKFIQSVTPSKTGSTTGTLSVGTSDLFGLNFLEEAWEHMTVYWAGAPMTSTTGFTAADMTNPATSSTGDVRGTIQTGAAGPGSGIGANASNGTRRLVIYQRLSPRRLLAGTVTDLFGVTQA